MSLKVNKRKDIHKYTRIFLYIFLANYIKVVSRYTKNQVCRKGKALVNHVV